MVSQEAHTASQGLHMVSQEVLMVSQGPHTVSPSPMVRVDIFEALIQCNLSMDNPRDIIPNNLNTNLNRVTIKVNPSKVNTLDNLSRANTNLNRITISVNHSKANTLDILIRANNNHIKVNTQGSLSITNTNHSRANTPSSLSRANTNHIKVNTQGSLSRTNTSHSRTNTNRIRANMSQSIKNLMIVKIRVQINNIRTLSNSTLVSHSLVNILACNLNKINIDHQSRINTVKVSNPAWHQGNRKRSRDTKVI